MPSGSQGKYNITCDIKCAINFYFSFVSLSWKDLNKKLYFSIYFSKRLVFYISKQTKGYIIEINFRLRFGICCNIYFLVLIL